MADTATTLTVTEITPGQQVYTPWGPITSAPQTVTKQIVLTSDQLAVLKAALG